MRSDKSNAIQIMRGIAIIMVLIHHALSSVADCDFDRAIIYALDHVHVVVFFVISGYLFEKGKDKYFAKSAGQYVLGRFKRMLVPYLFWFLLPAVGIKLISGIAALRAPLDSLGLQAWSWKDIFLNALTFSNFYFMHLWFVYVLFIITVINYFTRDLFSDWRAFAITALAIAVLRGFVKPPFVVDKLLIHFLNYSVGRMILRYDLLKVARDWRCTAACALIIICLAALELRFWDVARNNYIARLLWGIAGTQLIYQASLVIGRFMKRCSRVLTITGDYSFEIYLMHHPYVTVLLPLALSRFAIPKFAVVLITVTASVLLPVGVVKLLSKRGFLSSIMFGYEKASPSRERLST